MQITLQMSEEAACDLNLLAYAQQMAKTAESELARHLFAEYVAQMTPRVKACCVGQTRVGTQPFDYRRAG